MIGIALRVLAARWSSFVGSFLALTMGVALSAAAGLALASAYGGPDQPPQWYVTPDVVVAGPGSVEPSGEVGSVPVEAVAVLNGLPGVRAVIVDRAGWLGDSVEAHPWSAVGLHPYVMTAGGPPEVDDEAVVSEPTPHRPGDRISLTTVDGSRDFTVSGVLRSFTVGEATPAVYVTEATADRLARGRITAVALISGAPSIVADVRSALAAWPDLKVLTGNGRRAAEPDPDAGLLVAASVLLGETAGIAAFVTAFVVAGTFAFSVSQRRREYALLRTAGATPGQIRRLVLGEALGIGVLGGLAGCALGTVIAEPYARWLARVGLAPADFTVRFAVWPLAAALGLGLLVAVLGAWASARRAGAVRPSEALREASIESGAMTRTRWLLGIACLAGVAPMVPLLRTPAGSAYLLALAMLLIVACALLAPALVPRLIRLFGAGTRGPVGVLARESGRTAIRRAASTAAPVLVTVGLAGAALAGTATYSAAQARGVRDLVIAQTVVIPSDREILSDATTRRVLQTPGVTAAVPVKQAVAHDRSRGTLRQNSAWYLDGPAAPRAFQLPVRAGSLADLTGDTVAISQSLVEEHHWPVGSTAQLWLGDGGMARLRVVAIVDDRLGLPAILLPWHLASVHSGRPVPDAIYVVGAPTEDGFVPVADYLTTVDAEFDRLARIALLAIIGMAVAYTAIAVANTNLMATAGRRRDLLTLRLAGATRGQLLRLVALEAALITAAGVVLGLAVIVATLALLVGGLSALVSTVPIVIPWVPLLVTVFGCVFVAVAGSLIPLASR